MSLASGDNAQLLSALLGCPPAQRAAHFRAGNGDAARLAALADEAERLSFADIPQALVATQLIVELADELGILQARARRARAQALAYAGRHDEALILCDQAVQLALVERNAIEAARAQLIRLHPLNELGRFDEAVRTGEAARLELLRLGEPRLAARADFNLGGIHQNRDDPRQALLHFDRAATEFRDEPLISGYLHNNRGEALLLLNDFEAAQQAFALALTATTKAQAGVAAAIVEGNLADLAARRGRLSEALEHFERARRQFEQNKAEGHLVRLLSEQAEAVANLGLAEDALAEYVRIIPRLAALGLTSEIARAHLAMGRLFLRLDRLPQATAALTSAAEGFEQLAQPRQKAHVDLLRSDLLVMAGDVSAAESLLNAAASALGDRPLDVALLNCHRARIEAAAGRVAQADDLLSAALSVAQQLDIAPLKAEFLTDRGELRSTSGRRAEAIEDFRAATHAIERVRESLHAEQHRSGFLGGRLRAYAGLVEALFDHDPLGAGAEIFETIERSKSRGLLDVLRGAVDVHAVPQEADASSAALQGAAAKLTEELNALYSVALGAAAPDQYADDGWRRAVNSREGELRRVEQRLSATSRSNAWFAPPIAVADIQQALEPGSAMLQLFQHERGLVGMLIGPKSLNCHTLDSEPEQLAEITAQLRFQINRAARPGALTGPRAADLLRAAQTELQSAWKLLIAPWESAFATIDHIIIVPHGPLHLMPFHALWNGAQYLIEQMAVSYAPSAGIWHRLQQSCISGTATTGKVAVVGVSDADAPQIADEARHLAQFLGADLYLNQAATRETVRSVLEGYSRVHLACHARFSAEHPASSGLLLADGWLTLREIFPLRMRLELATLSGCSTGQNIVRAGDELFGLLRGFLSAGARSVVASLWPAHDEGTFQVMSALYTELSQMPEVRGKWAAAVRSAQMKTLARNPHPFIWAPFMLVGAS